jgi:hypothetical protein
VRDRVLIVLIPDQFDPLNIFFPVKLVKVLQQESIILNIKIDDPSPPLSFGFQTRSQAVRL